MNPRVAFWERIYIGALCVGGAALAVGVPWTLALFPAVSYLVPLSVTGLAMAVQGFAVWRAKAAERQPAVVMPAVAARSAESKTPLSLRRLKPAFVAVVRRLRPRGQAQLHKEPAAKP